MKNNKIPNANEFMEDYMPRGIDYVYPVIAEGVIEFAKFHVDKIKQLQKTKYILGETGYLTESDWKEIMKEIK